MERLVNHYPVFAICDGLVAAANAGIVDYRYKSINTTCTVKQSTKQRVEGGGVHFVSHAIKLHKLGIISDIKAWEAIIFAVNI